MMFGVDGSRRMRRKTAMTMKWTLLLATIMIPAVAMGVELQPRTLKAFDAYVVPAEAEAARRARGGGAFLGVDEDPARLERVRNGEVVIDQTGVDSMTSVPGGLIHDWTGAAFITGVTLEETLRLCQDYESHDRYYRPEVVESKLHERDGDRFEIFYRLLKKKVITIVLDTEHEVRYFHVDESRAYSQSRATRISEVRNAGESNERVLPDGRGGGYLWRLNSYWRFEERDGGVYVELRAISLTRDIPTGTGWLVKPIVAEMPRISIHGTLTNTRDALLERGAEAAAAKRANLD